MDKNKIFSIGSKINISTKTYADLNNKFLDSIGSIKPRYSDEQVYKDIQKGKTTRPIVIIGSNKGYDKVIAVAETTSNSKYNLKYNFKTSEGNIGYPQILILDKIKTKKAHVYKKFSQEEIDNFKKGCSENSKKSFLFLEKKSLEFYSESQSIVIQMMKDKEGQLKRIDIL